MTDLEALIAELSQVRRLLADPDLSWAAEDDLVRRGADLAEMICAEQRRVLDTVVSMVEREAMHSPMSRYPYA